MPSLSETQSAFRNAVATGASTSVLGMVQCPGDAAERLEIYRRHHREGFRRHLRGRYPTLEWLLGTPRLVELADATLTRCPPRAPSLAEYGEALVATVAGEGERLPPYAEDAARLDWSLGCLSVSIAHAPVAITALGAIAPGNLAQLSFGLQPGLVFMACGWPVDELVHLHHRDDHPERLVFAPRQTLLQLHGARGRFTLQRLSAGSFAFRQRLSRGETLGTAAEAALQADPDFDLSTALASLFAEDLVIHHSQEIIDA